LPPNDGRAHVNPKLQPASIGKLLNFLVGLEDRQTASASGIAAPKHGGDTNIGSPPIPTQLPAIWPDAGGR
jgi:hypothetical protein